MLLSILCMTRMYMYTRGINSAEITRNVREAYEVTDRDLELTPLGSLNGVLFVTTLLVATIANHTPL